MSFKNTDKLVAADVIKHWALPSIKNAIATSSLPLNHDSRQHPPPHRISVDESTMYRTRIIDHSVHRPCEEGINIAVRIAEVQRSQQGIRLVSSSNQPGHWPWSITIKATSFANMLSIQIGRAHRGDQDGGGGGLAPKTGWKSLLMFPTGTLDQEHGQGHGLHANHPHHPNNINDDNQSDHSDDENDDFPIENVNVPALVGAIRRGDLKLPFDPDRFRWVSVYSPLRRAEVVSQEYRKDASFQEISVQATDVKEFAFYHFQIWFSSALRIPRLVSSSLNRLQQSMLRLRKDNTTANVCIRLVDPEDEFRGPGKPGAGGRSDGGGNSGGNSGTNTNRRDARTSSTDGDGDCFPDRCFSETSMGRNRTTFEGNITATPGTRKRSALRGSDDAEQPAHTEGSEGENDHKGKKKARHIDESTAQPVQEPRSSPSSPGGQQTQPSCPSKQTTRAGEDDLDSTRSEEEEVVVFAHKSILEGDAFFNRLLSSGFHEATPDTDGMHTITLSREFFPTKQVIDTILDFVYAEVITADLLQPIHDHALVKASDQDRCQSRADPASTTPSRLYISDRIKANVFRCMHGLSAIEMAKVGRCPHDVLLQARRPTDTGKVTAEFDLPDDHGRLSSVTLSPGISSSMAPKTGVRLCAAKSDNVPLLSEDGGVHHPRSIAEQETASYLPPSRCQGQLASLTQLWDDLYGAAHFMQNDHLRLIAFSQLQLDQRTTLARAMRRGCMFQEVEQAMHHYLIREQRLIFGNPKTNQLRPYFLVDNPFQMSFLLNLTSSMAHGNM